MKFMTPSKFIIVLITLLSMAVFFEFVSINKSAYHKPSHITQEQWDEVSPYFLPPTHPFKPILDKAFSKYRVLHSKETVELAGFTLLEDKDYDLMVARHADDKKHLIKFYFDYHDIKRLDTEGERLLWVFRIQGIERVEKVVSKYQYSDIVKLPKKWIYPLPENPKPLPYGDDRTNFRKSFILVTEDMNIVSDDENLKMYKKMGPRQVKALYDILNETQLYDSIYIDNNPFTQDGKLTFIDTEEFDRKPVLYERVTAYFSSPMQEYWKTLYLEEDQ